MNYAARIGRSREQTDGKFVDRRVNTGVRRESTWSRRADAGVRRVSTWSGRADAGNRKVNTGFGTQMRGFTCEN